MDENLKSPIFHTTVPVVDFEFNNSPLLSELFEIFNNFPTDALHVFLNALESPRFSMMRQQPNFVNPSPENHHLKPLFEVIRRTSNSKLYDVILATSIITNVSPDEIVRLSKIEIAKIQLDLINLALNSIYKPESTVAFRSTGRISIIKTRPTIPDTFHRYFNSRDLLFAKFPENREIDKLVKSPNSGITRDLLNAPGFSSADLSTGFNKRNGIPDVICYNDIDNETPLIIKWVDLLKFPRAFSNHKIGCQKNCFDCLTCHQKTINGKKTLTYQKDGRINIEDLKDHIPLIFECNEQCCCELPQGSHSSESSMNYHQCPNKVVQKRWKWKLAVIRTTRSFEWTVRTFEFIPKGSFVCEMLGRVISSQSELEVTLKSSGQNGKSALYNLDAYHVPVDAMLIMDTQDHGNVSSYMEPSLIPNLVPISICIGEALSCHRIAFFAIRDIFPNEDLTFHPNYSFNWSKHLLRLERNRK
ncbi:hypothetical protein TRFO_24800 [Tritrichomonas foetus]|uniref:SET domain-containing protein n=1 Tax=Tritrichomonas foetus TaxID=1144522 RepID=A0A1J4K7Z4_9EUKA|nr:hypothetical protein TRFO_24800 [Tritrichomonas foetus]|eukprot:OHT07000.1 hypothetical protein TRFO_24800 [Tritrichomonas foetus]